MTASGVALLRGCRRTPNNNGGNGGSHIRNLHRMPMYGGFVANGGHHGYQGGKTTAVRLKVFLQS